MSQPDPQAALTATVAALSEQLATHRGQLSALSRYAHDSHDELTGRFEELARTVTEALDAASPRGPAASRWDNLDHDAYRRQPAWLRQWVNQILIPGYVTGGAYHLADCWDQHPHAVLELSTLAAQWRRAYDRKRPDLPLALEWHDRWLPGAMRRIDAATRNCTTRHRSA